ncbi:MAG: hypothetical protein ABSC41_19575 [Acidimicrobiales bacterium]|jgi:energy-converting hydrogenase Eha subunit E
MTALRTDQPDRMDAGSPRGEIFDWVNGDPELLAACAAAVDPLEVAARLETHGLSKQVAVESFGFPDVFSTAQFIYASLAFETEGVQDTSPEPMGGPADLLRGALYALPAVFLPVVVGGFAIHSHWWAMPIGLTVAWAVSQAAVVTGWTLRALDDQRSDSLVAMASIVVSAAVCLGGAFLAWHVVGGNEASVLEAVGVAVYVAAAGVLVFHNSEWLLAVSMVPAAVGSLCYIGLLPITMTHRTSAWLVASTVVIVAVAAIGSIRPQGWRRPALDAPDLVRACKYSLYGLGCGLLTSAFIGFADESNPKGGALVIAVLPLLATLGLMEWQLRSFQSRAKRALSTTPGLDQFAGRIRSDLLCSAGAYVAALAILSTVSIVIGHDRHDSMVTLLVASVAAIGVSFFLALLLASSGQINPVLVSFGATLVVFVVTLAAVHATRGHITLAVGLITLLLSTVTAIVLLSISALRVLPSPFNY